MALNLKAGNGETMLSELLLTATKTKQKVSL